MSQQHHQILSHGSMITMFQETTTSECNYKKPICTSSGSKSQLRRGRREPQLTMNECCTISSQATSCTMSYYGKFFKRKLAQLIKCASYKRKHTNLMDRDQSQCNTWLLASAVCLLLVSLSCPVVEARSSSELNFAPIFNQNFMQEQQQQQQQQQYQPIAPSISPFFFNQPVREGERVTVLCTLSMGDLPANISWLKDGQLLTPNLALAKKIQVKPDVDQSTLKFTSVRLDQAGNYTCVARNKAGTASHSALLVVQGEPRWLREPHNEPIVATRGQTIVVDCLTTGYPRPNQTWSVKRHTQIEFEPVEPSAKIALLSNGSLIIRNADKSDEANYLCRSSNGIGRAISWSTSLKVNVPAHFEGDKQQTLMVRKQSQVLLRCDAQGDEPLSIEWFKNKQRITEDQDLRYSIRNNPIPSGLISQLMIKQSQRQDNAVYECATRNLVGRDRQTIELHVQEEPESIQELQVSQIQARSVNLIWTEPYDGRSPILSYMFQYKKLHSIDAGSQANTNSNNQNNGLEQELEGQSLEQTGNSISALKQQLQLINDDDWHQSSRFMVPTQLLNSSQPAYTIRDLEPSSKYLIRALASNAIGQSRFSQPMEFSTEDEAPQVATSRVQAVAVNSTSIRVTWDEIPRTKQLGRIHGYYIGYRLAANSSSSGQTNYVKKPFLLDQTTPNSDFQAALSSSGGFVQLQRLETVITELKRNTAYEIAVFAFNLRGSGPPSEPIMCRTNEMEAPKPVKLLIRRESNESIFIEWQRDPLDQNPVDDYLLYQEKNSASQEWLQVRLPGNQTQYKAPGLKCGTRYQFYIMAQNKMGKSLPSDVVSASTSGALPVVPSKQQLIKMVNSSCLVVNLNTFQDNGCRIKNFNVRFRLERNSPLASTSSSSAGSSGSSSGVGGAVVGALSGANGLVAQHQALTSSSASSTISSSSSSASKLSQPAASSFQQSNQGDWITIRPKSNARYQRGSDEDRMEYLCDLNPVGEYTIHVSATNDVGRSEIEYSVLMSSDELRYSALRELLDSMPKLFAYIPSILIISLAALLMVFVGMIMYTASIKYYQNFVILQNQIRASRKAKSDEKRRRKLNGSSRQSQKLDLWADEYDDDEVDDDDDAIGGDEFNGDGDDEEDDELEGDEGLSSTSSNSNLQPNGRFRRKMVGAQFHQRQHSHPNGQFKQQRSSGSGHYVSNLAARNFHDSSSIGSSRCMKYNNNSSCLSTASTDSVRDRFQCLNAKHYVKMNEYTIMPSISASLSPQNNGNNSSDIYGTTGNGPMSVAPQQGAQLATLNQQQQQLQTNNSSPYGYYGGLRRPSMQTYLPPVSQAPQYQTGTVSAATMQQHRGQNLHQDIYGYYMAPKLGSSAASPAEQAANEAANSIFVPPQQHPIIYSAPNIRRQPSVFL